MPQFRANIDNLPGYGEVATHHKRGGLTLDKYVLTLDNHTVTIKQRKAVLKFKLHELYGKRFPTSIVYVSNIDSMNQGAAIVNDLCWILSFATQSFVSASMYWHGKKREGNPHLGVYHALRPPFVSGWGSVSDFVQQAWPQYQRLKAALPLWGFIHLIDASDADTILESKIARSMQCLECIKTYFALSGRSRHDIRERSNGKFVDASGGEITFRELLELTLQEVGMTLPNRMDRIIRLRNALVHRGFIRETDRVTNYIFGKIPAGRMHLAMIDTMEDVQDILREYMLRLLGYKGRWCAYKIGKTQRRTIP